MEFCDECGAFLLPSKGEDGKKVFRCKCGAIKPFSEEQTQNYRVSTKIEQPIRNEVTSVAEMLKWKDDHFTSSIKNFKCSQCGYDKAHIETRQTRSADEGMTHFITCLKCGKMRKKGS